MGHRSRPTLELMSRLRQGKSDLHARRTQMSLKEKVAMVSSSSVYLFPAAQAPPASGFLGASLGRRTVARNRASEQVAICGCRALAPAPGPEHHEIADRHSVGRQVPGAVGSKAAVAQTV